MGDENYDFVLMFKSLMIYAQAYFRKVVLPENMFYLMVPILHVFRNYRNKAREKYIAGYYISLMNAFSETAPQVNPRNERDYENYINKLLSGLEVILKSIDSELAFRIKEFLAIEDAAVSQFYLDLLSNVRKGEITHIPNADLTLSKQQVILGEVVRSFIDRMSVGFTNIKLSCILWDFILIKPVKDQTDLILAFGLIMFNFKEDILRCSNIIEFVGCFKERALLMHEYDFYVSLFNYHKGKDFSSAFEPPQIVRDRTIYPNLQDVISDTLRKKIENDKSMG